MKSITEIRVVVIGFVLILAAVIFVALYGYKIFYGQKIEYVYSLIEPKPFSTEKTPYTVKRLDAVGRSNPGGDPVLFYRTTYNHALLTTPTKSEMEAQLGKAETESRPGETTAIWKDLDKISVTGRFGQDQRLEYLLIFNGTD